MSSRSRAPGRAVRCTKFEPQLFRKTLCRNCFKTEAQHREDSEQEDTKATSSEKKNVAGSAEGVCLRETGIVQSKDRSEGITAKHVRDKGKTPGVPPSSNKGADDKSFAKGSQSGQPVDNNRHTVTKTQTPSSKVPGSKVSESAELAARGKSTQAAPSPAAGQNNIARKSGAKDSEDTDESSRLAGKRQTAAPDGYTTSVIQEDDRCGSELESRGGSSSHDRKQQQQQGTDNIPGTPSIINTKTSSLGKVSAADAADSQLTDGSSSSLQSATPAPEDGKQSKIPGLQITSEQSSHIAGVIHTIETSQDQQQTEKSSTAQQGGKDGPEPERHTRIHQEKSADSGQKRDSRGEEAPEWVRQNSPFDKDISEIKDSQSSISPGSSSSDNPKSVPQDSGRLSPSLRSFVSLRQTRSPTRAQSPGYSPTSGGAATSDDITAPLSPTVATTVIRIESKKKETNARVDYPSDGAVRSDTAGTVSAEVGYPGAGSADESILQQELLSPNFGGVSDSDTQGGASCTDTDSIQNSVADVPPEEFSGAHASDHIDTNFNGDITDQELVYKTSGWDDATSGEQHFGYLDSSGTTPQQTLPQLSADTLSKISSSAIFHHYPAGNSEQQWGQQYSGAPSGQPVDLSDNASSDWYYNSNVVPSRSQTDEDHDIEPEEGAYSVRHHRKRPSVDESAWQETQARMSGYGTQRDGAMLEGTRMLIDTLREKVADLEDKGVKLSREKRAISDLLSNKKEEFDNMEEQYAIRIGELEDQVKRVSSEKMRLLDRLKLPESERFSMRQQENEIAHLQKKVEAAENRFGDMLEENASLKQEIRDLQLEMDEMHDQFREDEAIEFRELQKELEAAAKNCRILQFKLRKTERRNDQMEMERAQYEEKIRQLESRFQGSDDKQHIRELEEELKMAKEVSVRLHDELELVEERRQRYEEELDRVNDLLTESESRRQGMQKEVDSLNRNLDALRTQLPDGGKSTLDVPQRAPSLAQTKQGSSESSTSFDLAQVMRDLSDSLERENDIKEQLKFAEEENRVFQKKLCELDEENESLNMQLQKLSAAKSSKFSRSGLGKEVITEREHELQLQMELAEQEVKVLHRKLDEMEQQNEGLVHQCRLLLAKLEGKIESKDGKKTEAGDDMPYDEKILAMADDIEALKWKLIEKDTEGDRLRTPGDSKPRKLRKSRSLEEYNEELSIEGRTGGEFQQDFRAQLEIVQQEAQVMREKLKKLEHENEHLVSENTKLGLLANRHMPSIKADDAALKNIELNDKIRQLDAENSSLRAQVKLLDERTSRLSKEMSKTKKKKVPTATLR